MVALLAWYCVSALSAVAGKSATFDEPFCLTGGYSYWITGDFRLQPENGNFPQRWAALPLLFGDYKFPSLDDIAWRHSYGGDTGVGMTDKFFYEVGNDADRMLFRGRVMITVLGVTLGLAVFLWSRYLFGVSAAFVSLTLFAFCPTMLTAGALTTTDMAAALFFMLAVSTLWIVLHQVNVVTVLASALAMGGMFVAKFSAVLLLPMAVILVGLRLMAAQPLALSWRGRTWQIASRPRRLAALLALAAFQASVVWVVIWASFNFRYEMFAQTTTGTDSSGALVVLDRPLTPWEDLVTPGGGLLERMILAFRERHLLPEGYLYGLAYTFRTTQERPAYLNGEFSLVGWPEFFPYCLLVKTPLTLFALMVLGLAAIGNAWWNTELSWPDRRRRAAAELYRAAPLWALFGVYWAVAIPSHLNIGHRHIVPTYPPMIILAGAAALWWQRRPQRRKAGRLERPSNSSLPGWHGFEPRRLAAGGALACLALFLLESLAQWPNYLAYFNQLAGGPANGYRHLVDSSLDWGQDLPALKKFLRNEGLEGAAADDVYLAYFGAASPRYYGIRARPLPGYANRTPPHHPQPWKAGTYVVSATMLQCVYTMFPERWNSRYEDAYQRMRLGIKHYNDTLSNAAANRQLIQSTGGESNLRRFFYQFEQARFARLASYLRRREPDANINYSLLVYRLSQDELDQALDGPPPGNRKSR